MLKASDLPGDGSSKLVLVDGVLFEVARERSTMDARKSVYKARQVIELVDGPPVPYQGWWYRFTWKLMLADLKLMAKEDDEK